MKVNEVITEAGVFDKLKAGIKGAVSGYTTSQGHRRQQQEIGSDRILRSAVKAWEKYVSDAKIKGQVITPENYEKHLNNWLGKQWFKLKTPWPSTVPFPGVTDSVTTKTAVVKYIAQALADYKATVSRTSGRDYKQTEEPSPEEDISKTLDPYTQYKFEHPDYPGINVVVRRGKWYLDKLPSTLRGQVQRDKETRMFPVLQPGNIRKFNQYYNDAADMGRVKEEPAVAL